MSTRFPLLIGITGKRKFDKDDAANDRAIAHCVGEKLKAIFVRLERDYPNTPKIVLTGLAYGADLIAAQAALAIDSPNWAVAAILPFKAELFEEDFRPEGSEDWRRRIEEHAKAFRDTIALSDAARHPQPRVMVRELPLLAADGDGAARLSRDSPAYDAELRRNHYEQVGQFIADAATILIAVMPADERAAGKADGGTARIVACRRAGRPDAPGQAVARRSAILRHEWPELVRPPGGSVWLIEPKADGFDAAADGERTFPATVLPALIEEPHEHVYDGHPGRDMPAPEKQHKPRRLEFGQYVVTKQRHERHGTAHALHASLALAKGFERFNRLTAALSAADQRADISEVSNIVTAIEESRRVTSRHQGGSNKRSKRVFLSLAILFVTAIATFEVFAKFFPRHPVALGLYILVLMAIAGFVIWARFAAIQPVSEDYRAVSEMLRVQGAWWAAGLRHRVDWEHLQGAPLELARARDAAEAIIAWLLLRRGWFPERDKNWARVRGSSPQPRHIHPGDKMPADWIGGQIWYFKKNAPLREAAVRVTEAASWCLFVASGWIAILLCAWLWSPSFYGRFHALAEVMGSSSHPFVSAMIGVFWLAATAVVVWLRVENRSLKRTSAIVATFVVALLAALFFSMAAVSAAHAVALAVDWLTCQPDAHCAHHDTAHTAEHIMVVGLVVLSAWAGAWRYLTERRNVEAEALEYPEAEGRFERAERLLAPGSDPATGTPQDEARAQALVLELGRLAMTENEAWLKSRRERPLTPVVG